jgi:hypothetical protein
MNLQSSSEPTNPRFYIDEFDTTPGSKEPYKVERDTNGDGKADTAWEKGAAISAKPH